MHELKNPIPIMNQETQRIGRFEIDSRSLWDFPADARAVFASGLIVLDCRYCFGERKYHYVALCESFREVHVGAKPPQYAFNFYKGKPEWREIPPEPPPNAGVLAELMTRKAELERFVEGVAALQKAHRIT